ncbi:MAG TPA: hypothetical protein VEY30_08590, partial [Myxococcaceae bacterium]|nr:hypothetical protein [Myxococcaceae bacterium]
MTFLKGLGYGLLALVGTVLLGLAVVWVALRTDWGSDRLRGVVLKTVNAAVAGGLEYQRLRLLGDRVVLEGVVLKDPEGEVVARVESIEIEAAFLALVRRDIRLEEVLIRAPELYLKADERGLNLNRAIAARAPPEPPKPGEPSAPPSLSFSVSRLSLERGTIEYLQEALDGGEPLKARVEAFSVQGHASYALGSGEVDAKLELRGDTRHPVRGPLALTVSASGDADKTLGELSANLPGLALAASARMEGSEAYGLEIRRLEVQPALVRSVVSTYPVAVPLSLKGTASLRGNVAEADLELAAGSAHLTAQGQVDIESMRARGLILRLRDANLAELVRGSPRSDLGLELKLDGGGTKLDTLDLTAFLKVPPSRIGGHPLGPVRMKALAQNGRFQIAELSALLPGVKLSAAGTGSERQVSFAGNLTVTDLKAFGDTLGRVATGQALPLEGSGSLDFSAEGPLDRPGLAVKGAFPRLVYQTV